MSRVWYFEMPDHSLPPPIETGDKGPLSLPFIVCVVFLCLLCEDRPVVNHLVNPRHVHPRLLLKYILEVKWKEIADKQLDQVPETNCREPQVKAKQITQAEGFLAVQFSQERL